MVLDILCDLERYACNMAPLRLSIGTIVVRLNDYV